MFRDRRDAGERLAQRLERYRGAEGVLVLAIPRGGVVVGDVVARALDIPMDILIVRKIGFPGNPELGIGAVSETGIVILDEGFISHYGVPKEYVDQALRAKKKEIEDRIKTYRGGKRLRDLTGWTVLLVDDGVATGGTMKAAISTLREEALKKLVVAVPVSSPTTAQELEREADEFVCLELPESFAAVGGSYLDFREVTDEDVVAILAGTGIA
jgi:putative phosphoribosyl transferase